jgi:HK97 family phage portal protein
MVAPPSSIAGKSWAELQTFFARERQDTGKDYKKEIRKQIKEYRSWVFSAIDCIVDRFQSVEFGFYRIDTKEELLPSSPYYKAITKPIIYPNDFMTFGFIEAWCQTQLDLCGKAAILKVRNQLGKVWELWPLDMNFFEGIEGATNNPLVPPTGFKFKIADEVRVFPIQDVIWLRYTHPESLWDGFSPIQSQAYATDIDYYLEVYERGFFKNSARVDFILEHEGNLDEEGAARLKEQWVKAYGGFDKSYQPVVASGGLKVVPITMSNKDFQFLETAKWTKDKILSAYRVPEGKLGLFKDINRANQKGIDIAFNEEAILPRCKLWDVEITKQLIYEFTDLVEMKHENPVPRDRETDLKELELRGGKTPINTVNELRVWWDGRKDIGPDGDVILIDNKLIPIGMAGEIEDPEGGGDRPGSGSDDPDYDTDNDPGGDESDKAVLTTVNRAIRHIIVDYDKALAHTNGWSYDRAVDFAEVRVESTPLGKEVKRLYIDSIKDGLSRAEFKKRLLTFLASKVYRRVNKTETVAARVPTDKE